MTNLRSQFHHLERASPIDVYWLTDVTAGYWAGLVWVIVCILSLELQQKYRPLQAG